MDISTLASSLAGRPQPGHLGHQWGRPSILFSCPRRPRQL